MFNNVKLASVLVAGSLVAGSAFAGQASLNQVTDFYVNAATVKTSHELQNQVYSDILSSAHQFEIDSLEVETQVLISKNVTKEDAEKEASE